MAQEGLDDLTTYRALRLISMLTDVSLDLRKRDGLERAARLGRELLGRDIPAWQRATANYFVANAWSGLRLLSVEAGGGLEMEQPELEKETLYLRKAVGTAIEGAVRKQRLCQMLTNLGNSMSYAGRIAEALGYWDRALDVLPGFPMALGNRGYGLENYAAALHDRGHQILVLKFARQDLDRALSGPRRRHLQGEAPAIFEAARTRIKNYLGQDNLEVASDMHGFSLGDSEDEIGYRKWCLDNRLFLNPLNDLGPYPIAAKDVLSEPSIVLPLSEGPYYEGLYNQLKQEFASARYLYYEGTHVQGPHFSDKGVRLHNTLDYPAYSLSTEKVKAAFRAAYSLFDKMAFFLNRYLDLAVPEHKVTFRTFWYERQEKKRGLRPEFRDARNWSLRGLFWLGKDLYEDEPGFREAMEPDARELAEIRNHLEHKYLKLHEDFWRGLRSEPDDMAKVMTDTLAFSVYRDDFETKTLRLLKMARAGLVYLSLAVHREERRRAMRRDTDAPILEMETDIWEDEWKL